MTLPIRPLRSWLFLGLILVALCGYFFLVPMEGNSTASQKSVGGTHVSQSPRLTAKGSLQGSVEDSWERLDTTQDYSLYFPALSEDFHQGTIRLVRKTPGLLERISRSTFVGAMLLDDALLQSKPLDHVECQFSIPIPKGEDEFAVLAEVPGYAPVAISLIESSSKVVLEKVEPVTIIVRGMDGAPIPGAVCWFMTAGVPQQGRGWIAALNQFGFQDYGITDAEGKVVFTSARKGNDNQVQVIPPGNLAGQAVVDIQPGQTVQVQCSFGFSVKGTVSSLASGAALPGATVLAVGRDQEQDKALGTAVADSEGHFRFEGLPANIPSVFLEGESEGYAFSRVELLTPKANELKEVQMQLAPAISASFLIQTPWGEPIPDCRLSIREERKGITLEGAQSDASGVVHITQRLRADRDYQVVFYIGDWVALGAENLVPRVTESITVSRVARIQSLQFQGLPKGFEAASIVWQAMSSVRPGNQAWPVDEASPLLPSGPGYWILHSASGQQLGVAGSLSQGVQAKYTINFEVAEVEYELPLGAFYSMDLKCLTGESLVTEDELEGGHQTFSVAPGVYSLRVWGGEVDREWTSLVVPQGGRSLGLIAGLESCGIEGRVLNAEGIGMPGLAVSALGMVPFGYRHEITDAGGNFQIPGLAPGAYMLLVSGGNAYGTLVLDQTQSIFLRPGQWMGPLEIHAAIATNKSPLSIAWSGSAEEGAVAWVVGEGISMVRSFPPNGRAGFPSPGVDGQALGVAFSPGILMVQDAPLSQADSQVILSPGRQVNKLRFIDEFGKARKDISFSLSHYGMPFQYFGNADEQGLLTVSASSGLGVRVIIRELGGDVYDFALEELLSSSEIMIPRQKKRHRVLVTDVDGFPLRNAVALKFGLGELHHADGFGALQLSFDSEEAFFVEAPGYLGRWLSEPVAQAIALPRVLFDVQFVPPESVVKNLPAVPVQIRLTPWSLGGEFAYEEFVDIPWVEDGFIVLPPLPEGESRIQILGPEGEIWWEKEYSIKDHEQILD